jgi:hypothetical protein
VYENKREREMDRERDTHTHNKRERWDERLGVTEREPNLQCVVVEFHA